MNSNLLRNVFSFPSTQFLLLWYLCKVANERKILKYSPLSISSFSLFIFILVCKVANEEKLLNQIYHCLYYEYVLHCLGIEI